MDGCDWAGRGEGVEVGFGRWEFGEGFDGC